MSRERGLGSPVLRIGALALIFAASPVAATASTVPAPPSAAAFSKAVVRTVRTSFLSLVFTVAMALPA